MSESKSISSDQVPAQQDILLNIMAQVDVQWNILNVLVTKYLTDEDKEQIRKSIHDIQARVRNKKELSITDKVLHEKQLIFMDMILPKE
ncbi:hypothetical protein FH869_00910 [Providencia rettgeri]|uniref:hypothetical protein n=1 Tax=Providencia TaxID=586 RepID=UPI001120DD32|nr:MULTISPECIES: hypothetical protein [unclassified Providencia]TNV05053.1 hypothetical protein FH869_00910 [Providencia rettgeri]